MSSSSSSSTPDLSEQFLSLSKRVDVVVEKKKTLTNLVRNHLWFFTYEDKMELSGILVDMINYIDDLMKDVEKTVDEEEIIKENPKFIPLSHRVFYIKLLRYITDIIGYTHPIHHVKDIDELNDPKRSLDIAIQIFDGVAKEIIKCYNQTSRKARLQFIRSMSGYSENTSKCEEFTIAINSALFLIMRLMNFSEPEKSVKSKNRREINMQRTKLFMTIFNLFCENKHELMDYLYSVKSKYTNEQKAELEKIIKTFSYIPASSSSVESQISIEDLFNNVRDYLASYDSMKTITKSEDFNDKLQTFNETCTKHTNSIKDLDTNESETYNNPWSLRTKTESKKSSEMDETDEVSDKPETPKRRSRSKSQNSSSSSSSDTPKAPSRQRSRKPNLNSDEMILDKTMDISWKEMMKMIKDQGHFNDVSEAVTEHVVSKIDKYYKETYGKNVDRKREIDHLFINKKSKTLNDEKRKMCVYDSQKLNRVFKEKGVFLFPSSLYCDEKRLVSINSEEKHILPVVLVEIQITLKTETNDDDTEKKLSVSSIKIQENRLPCVFLSQESINSTSISRFMTDRLCNNDKKKQHEQRSFGGYTVNVIKDKELPQFMKDARSKLTSNMKDFVLSFNETNGGEIDIETCMKFMFPLDSERKDVVLYKSLQPVRFMPTQYIELYPGSNEVFIPSEDRCVIRRIAGSDNNKIYRSFIAWDKTKNEQLPVDKYGLFGFFHTPSIYRFYKSADDVETTTKLLATEFHCEKNFPRSFKLNKKVEYSDNPNIEGVSSSGASSILCIPANKCTKQELVFINNDNNQSDASDSDNDDSVPLNHVVFKSGKSSSSKQSKSKSSYTVKDDDDILDDSSADDAEEKLIDDLHDDDNDNDDNESDEEEEDDDDEDKKPKSSFDSIDTITDAF